MSLIQLTAELKTAVQKTDSQPALSGRELNFLAWLTGFFIAIVVFGFSFGAPPVVAGYVYFAARERLHIALIAGLICFGFMYGLFEHVIKAQLFDGLLIHYLK